MPQAKKTVRRKVAAKKAVKSKKIAKKPVETAQFVNVMVYAVALLSLAFLMTVITRYL